MIKQCKMGIMCEGSYKQEMYIKVPQYTENKGKKQKASIIMLNLPSPFSPNLISTSETSNFSLSLLNMVGMVPISVLYLYSPKRPDPTTLHLYSLHRHPRCYDHMSRYLRGPGGHVPYCLNAAENPYCFLWHNHCLKLQQFSSAWQHPEPSG